MTRILKTVRRVKLLGASALNLLIQGAESGAATAALLAQAHNLIVLSSVSNGGLSVLALGPKA